VESKLPETVNLDPQLPIGGEVRERVAGPQLQREIEETRRCAVTATPKRIVGLADQPLELVRVDASPLEAKGVAPADMLDGLKGAKRAPEPRDVRAERDRGTLGGLARPELVDQAIGGDGYPWLQGEDCQQPPRPRPAELDRRPVPRCLDRAEEADPEPAAIRIDLRLLRPEESPAPGGTAMARSVARSATDIGVSDPPERPASDGVGAVRAWVRLDRLQG